VVREASRLGALEARQQRTTATLVAERRQLATLHAALALRRDRLSRRVASVRARLASVARELPAHAATGGTFAPLSAASGFVFPLPTSAAASPPSWSLDDGVDIAAAGHTPLYAVRSGTVVLHGIGGFGPWAPVLRLDDGRYVYYGHAGPGNSVPVGTHVRGGQVIGEVGAGIVGISTGPHLEIGFADSSGSPLGPSSAPQMAQSLRGAY
jgi:murein DD-endopeptidase MepM/ murein hydrolase activator NlpD